MTNPTLERAARALFNNGFMIEGDDGWDKLPEPYKAMHIAKARAVLMAVREPGMDVGLIGAEQVNRNMRGKAKADYCAAKDAFVAMIDAILAPEWPVDSVTADLDSFKKRYIKPEILAEGE